MPRPPGLGAQPEFDLKRSDDVRNPVVCFCQLTDDQEKVDRRTLGTSDQDTYRKMTTTNHQHQLDYLSQLPKTFSTTHHSQTASIDPYQIIESELKLNSRTNPGHDFLAQKLSQHENHLQIEFDTLLQQVQKHSLELKSIKRH